jgi:hypothetical protein
MQSPGFPHGQYNNSLLHYAPYQIVIVPSTRFYETLCVAEEGQKRDPDHQHPVYHSITPNSLAKQYEDQKFYPTALLSDVALDDNFCSVLVVIPCGTEKNQMIHFLVRIVTIKRSKDYKTQPKNGSCCLSNPWYFESCTRIFDSFCLNLVVVNLILTTTIKGIK